MRVAVLDRRFPHHSAYSGYGQIVRRLDDVELITDGWPRNAPNRLADAIVRRTSSRRLAYSPTSLGLELAAARRMLRRPRAVYHVLYGEDDYHYLAAAAPLLRRAGGGLVASFHQPPAIFDEAIPSLEAQRILPRLDAAIVCTSEQAHHLSRWIAPERIHRVPHGVDTAFFAPDGRSRDPHGAHGAHRGDLAARSHPARGGRGRVRPARGERALRRGRHAGGGGAFRRNAGSRRPHGHTGRGAARSLPPQRHALPTARAGGREQHAARGDGLRPPGHRHRAAWRAGVRRPARCTLRRALRCRGRGRGRSHGSRAIRRGARSSGETLATGL